MYRPYQIRSTEIETLVNNVTITNMYSYKLKYDEFISGVKAALKIHFNETKISNNLANGSRLQELTFPSDNIAHNFDVFISHSHKDEEKECIISKFASYLYGRYGIRCFIDSEYWGYCNKLIINVNRQIGKHSKFNLNNGRTLTTSNTDDLLYISSNIYTMLSIALMRMIDNIPCEIFVDSEESISHISSEEGKILETTKSAWIYEEINYINSLREKKPDYYTSQLTEGVECFSAGFAFNVDKGNFKQLSAEFLQRLPVNDREKAMCKIFDEYNKLKYTSNHQFRQF